MARRPDVAVRVATLALMAVAYATCEVASYLDGLPRPVGVGFGIAALLVATVMAMTLRPRSGENRPSRRLQVVLALVLIAPLVIEPLIRLLFGEGFPLEMQLVNGLRVFGLSLAGLSAWPRFRRLAGVVALFLALFASAMGDQPAIPFLLVAFALTGGVWLILEHLSGGGTGTAVADGELRERVSMRLPYREAVVFGVLAVAAAGVAVSGPKRVMLSLGELMPTSGGTGDTDPFARYGIGDGPEEVAGDNAKAAGMVETDKMIEDNRNALIDAVNDMYGPPHKTRKDQDRMVAAGLAQIIENHGKLPDNRRPSRDFDTGRKGKKSDKTPESQSARGILEVEGRTPLHIRVVAYERYLAAEHRWEEAKKPGSRLLDDEGGDWMRPTNHRDTEWYATDDRHRIKVANLSENLVPTPSHLVRFRINKVDKPDYYEWDYDGVLALNGRKKTPPGVVVTTDCRTLDPARLGVEAFATPKREYSRDVPAEIEGEITRLAREWAGDAPRGWPQVAAILTKLRTEYTLDPEVSAPSGHSAPVLWFLTESRKGPDYLFATAATLMLRSLDYPARVCLGYYASPGAYDPETAHTPVRKTDLHVWPEVQLADNHWLVVEPTPGYETLPRLKPWRERFAELVADAFTWAKRNALALVPLVVLFVAVIVKWRFVADRILTAVLRLNPGRSWRDRSLRTMKLLDRRSRLAGRPRPETTTLSDWVDGLHGAGELRDVVRLTEWAAYAPNLTPPDSVTNAVAVCRTAVRTWPLSRFQRLASETRRS